MASVGAVMRLRDKITMAKRPVVVYEILPPRIIDGTIESVNSVSSVSYLQHEIEENDKKRTINVLRKKYIGIIIDDMRKIKFLSLIFP